jgi:tape measure domain-containing protein
MATNVVDFLIRLNAHGGNAINVARRVDANLTKIVDKANKAGGALRNAFSMQSLGNAVMSAPFMQFLLNPYVAAGAAVSAVTSIGTAAEQTAVSFEVMLGSEEKSKKMLEDIGNMDAKKVFGLSTMQDAAKQMLTFGVNSEEVLGHLSKLGDIASGDKNKLNSLALTFGQVTAAGQLTGGDLLQFINAGFNPLQELATMTGEELSVLKDKMSKGAISAQDVAAAISHATGEGGKFHDMTGRMAETTGVKLQGLRDKLVEMAMNLWPKLEPLVVGIISVIETIMPVIGNVANAIFGFVSDTISFIGEWKDEILLAAGILGVLWLAANVATIGVTLLTLKMKIMSGVTKVATTIQGAFNAIMALNPIGLVVMAIAALALGVIYCWNKFAGFRAFLRSTWAVLKELGGVIKTYVTDPVTELIGALGDVGEMFKLFFTGKWEEAAEKAKSAFTKLSGVNSAKNLVSGTKGAIEYGKNYYNASLEEEQKKEESEVPTEESFLEKIQNITLPPDGEYKLTGKGGKGGKGGKTGKGDKKTASAAATGGQRSTKIEMHIGKFFDQMNVYMMDKMDTAELERAIVQSMNRALAIATSTDR